MFTIKMKILYLLVIYLNVLFQGKHCFNFDINFPIIYKYKSGGYGLSNNSYFGYSVILYGDRNIANSWIQIGAPRGGETTEQQGEVMRCSIGSQCYRLNMPKDSKSDGIEHAWIGSVMDIHFPSKKVVVCGFRWYTQVAIDYRMQGICYLSTSNKTVWNKLSPLSNTALQLFQNRAYYYGQGQAGFSARFTNSMKLELLLGAPGFYNWGGNALLYSDADDDLLFSSSELIIPKTEMGNKFDAFSLSGYEVVSGYFFYNYKLMYAVGSPKYAANKYCTGKVTIGEFRSDPINRFLELIILEGHQMGEYFGSAMTVADINGDNYDDLIVGAPYYSEKSYNEGKIYIFFGNSKRRQLITPDENPTITGKKANGLFGLTLMSLGDIDFDGFKDIAVAAPYEDEQRGTIYIYRGNKQGISESPCQTIYGKDVDTTLRGFGISMAKPVDVDGNHFYDLAVGSYLSGQAVLLRSRPLVNLNFSLSTNTKILEREATDFVLTICHWYIGTSVYVPDNLTIRRTIIPDINFGRVSYIEGGHLQNITIYPSITTMEKYCTNVTLSFKDDQINYLEPIKITVEQDLIAESVKKSPMVIDAEGITGAKLGDFCSNCPILDTHKSKLRDSITLPFSLGCGGKNECNSHLEVSAEFEGINNNEFIVGSTARPKLTITVKNTADNAYSTQVRVEFSKNVHLGKIPPVCFCETCINSNENLLKLVCDIGNPLKRESNITFDLDVKNVIFNYNKPGENFIDFKMNVSTSSNNVNVNNNGKALPLYFIAEADVTVTGNSEKYSISYANMNKSMVNFSQLYEVNKYGESPLEEVLLEIKIPIAIKDKGDTFIKFLDVYKPEAYYMGQSITCSSNISYIENVENVDVENPDDPDIDESEQNADETEKSRNPVRRKRQDKEKDEEEYYKNSLELPPSNRTLYINCSMDNVECININCSIGAMKYTRDSAKLQLKMILNVNKLSDIMGKKDIVYLSTDGHVFIKSPPDFIQSGDRSDTVRLSNIFLGEIPEEHVDLWTIIIAICIGFLILIVLIIGLVKAGFFKRTKKMEMQRLKDAEYEPDTQDPMRISTEIEECTEDTEDPIRTSVEINESTEKKSTKG